MYSQLGIDFYVLFPVPQFVGNVIDVLSELQEWPEESLQSEDSGAR